jgi:hypothetical protein
VYKFPVFVDQKGNRFIFPGLYTSDIDGRSATWSYCLQLEIALKVKKEAETFDVVPGIGYSYVESEATSPSFAHGGDIVHLIGGPLFDEVVAECAANE